NGPEPAATILASASANSLIVSASADDLAMTGGNFGFDSYYYSRRGRSQPPSGRSDQVAIRSDERLNAIIVTGDGSKFALVESLIEVLDKPTDVGSERVVRMYKVNHADLDTLGRLLVDVFTDPNRTRRWWEESASDVEVYPDARSNTLIVSAVAMQHDDIAALITDIDTRFDTAAQQTEVLAVEYAEATELAETLTTFLDERAEATNGPEPAATILASASANSLIVSASADDLATIRDLLTRIDQPDVSGDRVVEIIAIRDGDAEEIAKIIEDQFGRRGAQRIVVTPDLRTSSIIINAPQAEFVQAKALIAQLDAPAAADETIIRTYTLESARAEEVENILAQTLDLDFKGETTGTTVRLDENTDAVEVIARVVADTRSNSLIVTATQESFPVIEQLIKQVDEVPAAAPREWRIIPLDHARAYDVYLTLSKFLGTQEAVGPEAEIDYHPSENQLVIAATADQFKQIDRVIAQVDVPTARTQITEFVPLEFVEAEKVSEALSFFYGKFAPGAETLAAENVRIVPDPASNSLVIAADEGEWQAIRALLTKLDSEEYDASLQLQVVALDYADATSVARAINEAFQGPQQRGQRDRNGRGGREQQRPGADDEERRPTEVPPVLVESEEWVRAAAEPLTNSIVVSASRKNLRKIEGIIAQLDVSDHAMLPSPRIIPVRHGDPQQLAASVEQLYRASGQEGARRTVRIVADPASGALIVRADEVEFEQIRTLAIALQQEATTRGLGVQVLRLESTPATRVAEAVRQAYATRAEQAGLALSIEVDAATNSLVVASTPELFEEIAGTVRQLDGLLPAAGQGIFIIELEHVSPEAAKGVIETIGLHERQPDDSVSRLVAEPITVSVLQGRNALIVVANPIDRDIVVGLLETIDQEPALAASRVRVVRLQMADAT
ncbi:MAG: secretin N-terminal domain-containing protein, partial [Planctomycetota bacterium]